MTITEQTRKLTMLGATLKCPDLAPGVIVHDEQLAEAYDDGHVRKNRKLEIIRGGRGVPQMSSTLARFIDTITPLELFRAGDPDHAPHDCFSCLTRDMECSVCHAEYRVVEK